MQECMNGSTGTVRHDDATPAVVRVTTAESHAESHWCLDCLTEYVACGMGRYLETVAVLGTPVSQELQRALNDARTLCGASVTETVD